MVAVYIAVGLLVLVVVAVIAIGSLLPVKHSVTVERKLPASAPQIWSVIADFAATPQWVSGVAKVEKVGVERGHEVWREFDKRGRGINYETIALEPPRLLERRIAETNLPYGGTWTYRLEGAGASSKVKITENGEVYSPLFRFVSKFIIGHTRTIKNYLDALEKRVSTTA